jgi:hypothetical protein
MTSRRSRRDIDPQRDDGVLVRTRLERRAFGTHGQPVRSFETEPRAVVR